MARACPYCGEYIIDPDLAECPTCLSDISGVDEEFDDRFCNEFDDYGYHDNDDDYWS